MGFEYWDSLSKAEKLIIIKQAEEAQDLSDRHICFWCGASLNYGGYDYTSNAKQWR